MKFGNRNERTGMSPFKIVQTSPANLTGHSYSVVDTRTGERIGDNLSRRLASEIAAEEWADEQGKV